MTSEEQYTDFEAELRAICEETGEEPLPLPLSASLPMGEALTPGTSASGCAGWTNKQGDRRGASFIERPDRCGRPEGEDVPYDGDTSRLHTLREDLPKSFAPRYQNEKWEHRIIAYLKAQGYSGKEISERTGYSYGGVLQILQLPWVKAVIMEEVTQAGKDAVKQVLEATTLDNVYFLMETRDNEQCARRDRITAAKELLDRSLGKANQPITHLQGRDLDALTDKELAILVNKGGRAN